MAPRVALEPARIAVYNHHGNDDYDDCAALLGCPLACKPNCNEIQLFILRV